MTDAAQQEAEALTEQDLCGACLKKHDADDLRPRGFCWKCEEIAEAVSRTPASGAVEALTDGIWDWSRANTLHLDDIDKCRALAQHLAALTSAPKAEGAKPVKKTMTVNLNDAEMAVLEELAAKKDVPAEKIFRLSLAAYQLADHEREHGPTPSGPLGLTAPQPLQGGEVTREALELLVRTAADTIKVTRGPMGSFYRTETPPEKLYALSVLLTQTLALTSPAHREGEG